MFDKDRANLLAILDSCHKIKSFTGEFQDADTFHADPKSFDAVLMNFVVIGEAVSRLSESFKSAHSEVPWIDVKGFRNMVAHDYFGVDAEEVWQIIQGSLPALDGSVRQLLRDFE